MLREMCPIPGIVGAILESIECAMLLLLPQLLLLLVLVVIIACEDTLVVR